MPYDPTTQRPSSSQDHRQSFPGVSYVPSWQYTSSQRQPVAEPPRGRSRQETHGPDVRSSSRQKSRQRHTTDPHDSGYDTSAPEAMPGYSQSQDCGPSYVLQPQCTSSRGTSRKGDRRHSVSSYSAHSSSQQNEMPSRGRDDRRQPVASYSGQSSSRQKTGKPVEIPSRERGDRRQSSSRRETDPSREPQQPPPAAPEPPSWTPLTEGCPKSYYPYRHGGWVSCEPER
jgi:hypothetical protein